MVALWVERGIHPNDVIAAPPELQDELERYLEDRAAELEAASSGQSPSPAAPGRYRRLTDAEMIAMVRASEDAMS